MADDALAQQSCGISVARMGNEADPNDEDVTTQEEPRAGQPDSST